MALQYFSHFHISIRESSSTGWASAEGNTRVGWFRISDGTMVLSNSMCGMERLILKCSTHITVSSFVEHYVLSLFIHIHFYFIDACMYAVRIVDCVFWEQIGGDVELCAISTFDLDWLSETIGSLGKWWSKLNINILSYVFHAAFKSKYFILL